eukprot:359523-Chlamydomonas_euryale.AAC.6
MGAQDAEPVAAAASDAAMGAQDAEPVAAAASDAAMGAQDAGPIAAPTADAAGGTQGAAAPDAMDTSCVWGGAVRSRQHPPWAPSGCFALGCWHEERRKERAAGVKPECQTL